MSEKHLSSAQPGSQTRPSPLTSGLETGAEPEYCTKAATGFSQPWTFTVGRDVRQVPPQRSNDDPQQFSHRKPRLAESRACWDTSWLLPAELPVSTLAHTSRPPSPSSFFFFLRSPEGACSVGACDWSTSSKTLRPHFSQGIMGEFISSPAGEKKQKRLEFCVAGQLLWRVKGLLGFFWGGGGGGFHFLCGYYGMSAVGHTVRPSFRPLCRGDAPVSADVPRMRRAWSGYHGRFPWQRQVSATASIS